MSRYSKLSSKYILAKRHMDISQGTLYERDWTTIGNVHRLEPGKRPYYGDGNFLFTENTFPVYKKKWKNGTWVANYTYEEVKDATAIVNTINVNTDSDNISDYAYWGSATELFRGSVQHIIETFPGRLRSTKKLFYIHHHRDGYNNGNESWEPADGYILANPFGLNMHDEFNEIPTDELLRYIALSWKSYVFEDYDNNNVEAISYYEVVDDKFQYDCEGKYFRLGHIILFAGKYSTVIDVYLADGKIVYCYRTNNDSMQFIIRYFSGLQGNDIDTHRDIQEFTIESNSDLYILPNDFSIHPNEEVIEEYFKKLTGFEWKLLNRKTIPFYKNVFLLPVQQKNGNWRLVRRKYIWPSEGYCIDIESTAYDTFINDMISLCEIYDNLWCDSIWRCMVHESVKNFDWSYRRQYDDNDEAENIAGGNRMRDVMRLYGLIYDNAKRYVDGISMRNTITYDGLNNCPTAQISDRNTLLGWDVVSTEHQFYWYEPLYYIPNVDDIVSYPALPINVDEESPEYVAVTCDGIPASVYYKKNTLVPSDIPLTSSFFETTDTYNNLIVQKQENPWISENSYKRLYVEIGYSQIIGHQFTTYNEYPYTLYDDVDCPEYICVKSNNWTRYYHLIEWAEQPQDNQFITNNENFVNGTWFTTRREKDVTPDTTDILFNRTLNLSANRILKTKGTKESIEMVMSLFGFGLYDENDNPNGDFKLEEEYVSFTAKDFDATFWFYEEIDESEVVGTPFQYSTIPLNPTEDSATYISVTYSTGTDSTYTLYYKLNGEYTVYEVVKLLYAHRTTEREYDNYYSGVPIKDVYSSHKHIIIPYYDNKQNYEGNLYFQAKGGWMKNTEKNEGSWEFSETLPYLHVLQRISDLFLINTNGVDNGDIYFVADISDYYTYTADVPYYLSNYFKLKDKYNPSIFSSWVNVPIEGPIQYGFSNDEDVSYEDYRHAKHLDSIIPMILFNNPHCGYDRYDMGNEYVENLRYPYKYSVENYMYDDDYYRNMASQFFYDMSYEYGEKVEITADTFSVDRTNRQILNSNNTDTFVNENHKFLKMTLMNNGSQLSIQDPNNRYHLEYMRNVVMKYVAQVIPSTTLLLLENFIPMENFVGEFGTITVSVMESGTGTVYGAGTYPKSTMVTLKAVPAEGYHFDRWTWEGTRTLSTPTQDAEAEPQQWPTSDEMTVMVCGDIEYTAWFVEDCGIGFGCNVGECGAHNGGNSNEI